MPRRCLRHQTSVGFGIAEPLRLAECRLERDSARAHLRQDEIAGAVDDAGDPFDPIRGQSFTQRLDDRNAARYCGLECQHHAARTRGIEELVAVPREQRLVGRDDMLAARDRFERSAYAGSYPPISSTTMSMSGLRITSLKFDETGTLEPTTARALSTSRTVIAATRCRDRPPRDLVLIALQDFVRSTADGAEAQQPDADGFHDQVDELDARTVALLNVTLRPFAADLAVLPKHLLDTAHRLPNPMFVSINAKRTWLSP